MRYIGTEKKKRDNMRHMQNWGAFVYLIICLTFLFAYSLFNISFGFWFYSYSQ